MEIGCDNRAESVGHILTEFRRYADFLYKRRKEVIYHFTRLDALDLSTAEAIFDRYEKRRELLHEPVKPIPHSNYPESEIYEQCAHIAQRYGIFSYPVCAAILIGFRDGTLSTPLMVRNVSRAVCFFKLLEHYGLIDRLRWKKLEESGTLARADGKPIVSGYMRRVASKLYLDIRLCAVVQRKNDMSGFNLYDKIAYDVWRVMRDI